MAAPSAHARHGVSGNAARANRGRGHGRGRFHSSLVLDSSLALGAALVALGSACRCSTLAVSCYRRCSRASRWSTLCCRGRRRGRGLNRGAGGQLRARSVGGPPLACGKRERGKGDAAWRRKRARLHHDPRDGLCTHHKERVAREVCRGEQPADDADGALEEVDVHLAAQRRGQGIAHPRAARNVGRSEAHDERRVERVDDRLAQAAEVALARARVRQQDVEPPRVSRVRVPVVHERAAHRLLARKRGVGHRGERRGVRQAARDAHPQGQQLQTVRLASRARERQLGGVERVPRRRPRGADGGAAHAVAAARSGSGDRVPERCLGLDSG